MREIFIDDLPNDILLMIIVTLISIVTTIGGVGGGGLLIPLYMIVGNFELKNSIPLTIYTIFGDTLVRIYFLYNKKNPLDSRRDLIYFAPLMIISLFDANSSFFGVILSNISPSLLTIACLLIILTITFYKSINKAISTYIKEEDILNNNKNGYSLIIIDGIGEYFKLTKEDEITKVKIGNDIKIITFVKEDDEELEQLYIIDNIESQVETEDALQLNENKRNIIGSLKNELIQVGDTQREKYFNTGLMFANVGCISIFSFTRQFFNVCDYLFWIHSLGQFFVTGALGYYTVTFIISDYQKKKQNHYIFIKGDIVWNKEVVRKFILIGTFTGFVSTYIGIGGGMMTTPIMIQVGMLPEVVVATSSISTFCSCFISSLNYFSSGDLPIVYGSVFAICSAIGSVGGIYASDYIISVYKKQSPIIFMVALIIFLSMILITINAVNNGLIYDYNFINICLN